MLGKKTQKKKKKKKKNAAGLSSSLHRSDKPERRPNPVGSLSDRSQMQCFTSVCPAKCVFLFSGLL